MSDNETKAQPPKFPMPDNGWGALSDTPRAGERFVVAFLAERGYGGMLNLGEAIATDKLPEDHDEDLREAWDDGPQSGHAFLADPSLEPTGEDGDIVVVRAIAELNSDTSITPAYALSVEAADAAAAGEFKTKQAAGREQENRRKNPEFYKWLDDLSARNKADLEDARARLAAMRRPPEPEPEPPQPQPQPQSFTESVRQALK